MAEKRLIKDLTQAELENEILVLGFEKYRAGQVLSEIYVKRTESFSEMTLLPGELRNKLEESFTLHPYTEMKKRVSEDGSVKFLFTLPDSNAIEAVYMPWVSGDEDTPERVTLCISSQAGCPLACAFCATGTLGFQRNLSPGEIVDQILLVEKELGYKITNIVFMGMGEPLMNYGNVVKSIEILTNEKNQLLRRKKITLSTAGIPSKIMRLADEDKPVKLALSLHATTNGIRSKIMPVAEKNDLTSLMDSIEYYYRKTKLDITYEYILFEGLNDSDDDIKRLARIGKRVPSRINIIPFNDISFTAPTGIAAELRPAPREKMEYFANKLRREGVPVILRDTFGGDIEAACGQLALSEGK